MQDILKLLVYILFTLESTLNMIGCGLNYDITLSNYSLYLRWTNSTSSSDSMALFLSDSAMVMSTNTSQVDFSTERIWMTRLSYGKHIELPLEVHVLHHLHIPVTRAPNIPVTDEWKQA